jgi:sec-independent protein translocase protein TatC
MATNALRRPLRHGDTLSVVGHLDELRTRLVICLAAVAVAFGFCLWQNDALLNIVNRPLETQTQKHIAMGQGPAGELSQTQKSLMALAISDRDTAAALAAPGSGLSTQARSVMAARVAQLNQAIAAIPDHVEGNKPVTLGIGEPFTMTLAVSGMFALILALPLILYQLYAFAIPALSPRERRTAVPLVAMIPVLFACGVAFGYFLVLPAAVRFLQNFNTDEFNVLVQARDYYKFVAMTLLATGLVFQIPVGILALTRLRVITVQQLRKNRRYAIVACAVVAMILPGTDPVSMLIQMVPLVLLFELSVLLARVFQPAPREVEAD